MKLVKVICQWWTISWICST